MAKKASKVHEADELDSDSFSVELGSRSVKQDFDKYIFQTYLNQIESQQEIALNIRKHENGLDKLGSELGAAQKTIDLIQERLEKTTTQSIEVLAIFSAIFTFIATEFQILKSLSDMRQIVYLTLILIGSLLLMISSLNFLIYIQRPKMRSLLFVVISTSLIITGLCMFPSSDGVNIRAASLSSGLSEMSRSK